MDVKTTGWKFDENQDSYMVWKYLPIRFLLKEKNSNFIVEKPGKHNFNQAI